MNQCVNSTYSACNIVYTTDESYSAYVPLILHNFVLSLVLGAHTHTHTEVGVWENVIP